MGERRRQSRPNRSFQTGGVSLGTALWFSIDARRATRGHRSKLFRKPKGRFEKKFVGARVVDLWIGLDDSAVSVDTIKAFKKNTRMRGMGCWLFKALITCRCFKHRSYIFWTTQYSVMSCCFVQRAGKDTPIQRYKRYKDTKILRYKDTSQRYFWYFWD